MPFSYYFNPERSDKMTFKHKRPFEITDFRRDNKNNEYYIIKEIKPYKKSCISVYDDKTDL